MMMIIIIIIIIIIIDIVFTVTSNKNSELSGVQCDETWAHQLSRILLFRNKLILPKNNINITRFLGL